MKTALQKLKEQITEAKNGNAAMDKTLDFIASLVESKMETEKQQIIAAYYAGTAQFANEAEIVRPKTPESYYEETFAQ